MSSRTAGFADFFPDRPSALKEKERSGTAASSASGTASASPTNNYIAHHHSKSRNNSLTSLPPLANGHPTSSSAFQESSLNSSTHYITNNGALPTTAGGTVIQAIAIPTPTDDYDGLESAPTSNETSSLASTGSSTSGAATFGNVQTLTPVTATSSPPPRTSSPINSTKNDSAHLQPVSIPRGIATRPVGMDGANDEGRNSAAVGKQPYTKPVLPKRNYFILYDPELEARGPARKSGAKPTYRFDGSGLLGPPSDPRLSIPNYHFGATRGKRRLRNAPYELHWEPDENTVGPGPPSQIVISGLTQLHTQQEVHMHFRMYGEISELEIKVDPTTGASTGIATVKYRENRSGVKGLGHECAKRAVKHGSGSKIGMSIVKVEFDRDGDRSKRLLEKFLIRKQKEAEDAAREAKIRTQAPKAPSSMLARAPPPPPPPPQERQLREPAPKRDRSKSQARERGRTRSKSPRRDTKQKVASPSRGRRSRSRSPAQEIDRRIVAKTKEQIGDNPYIFVGAKSIPSDEKFVVHFRGRLRRYEWDRIVVDETGFFIRFARYSEAERCFDMCDGMPLFSYTMDMEIHRGQNGRGDSRSRSRPKQRPFDGDSYRPGRDDRPKEKEREVRKKIAAPVDPVIASHHSILADLRSTMVQDIKKRITAASLFDSLDQHRAKRQKATDLVAPFKQPLPYSPLHHIAASSPVPKSEESAAGPSKGKSLASLPRFRKKEPSVSKPAAGSSPNKKRRQVSKATHVRPLHHRVAGYDDSAEDSEEDNSNVPTRSVSRALYPSSDEDETSTPQAGTPQRRMKTRGRSASSRLVDMSATSDEESEEDLLKKISKKRQQLAKARAKQKQKEEEEEALKSTPLPFEMDVDDNDENVMSDGSQRTRIKPKAHRVILSSSEEEELDEVDLVPVPDISQDREDAALKISKADDSKAQQMLPTPEITVDDEHLLDTGDEKSRSKKKRKAVKRLTAPKKKAAPKKKKATTVIETEPEDEVVEDIVSKIPVPEPEDEPEIVEKRVRIPVADLPEWARPTTGLEPQRTFVDNTKVIRDLDAFQDLVKDDEDLEFLKLALKDEQPASIDNIAMWAYRQKEMKAVNLDVRGPTTKKFKHEGYYRPNSSGSARTQGFSKIPDAEKAQYLPHRVRLAKQAADREAAKARTKDLSLSNKETQPIVSKVPKDTSRSNRANNRRIAQEVNLQRQTLAAVDVHDVINFNQLKKRKKPVRFARSAIHNWGLYAMENIMNNEMIIEYVGEIVRQQVADIRERNYLRSGIGSSYLFRIDESTVIDATKKGGIARFINHSCTPNCTAKIIKVEGTKRIVIYALRDIAKDEELTYDYKFEREIDSEERIPCLCGSSGCKGFLN